MSQADRESGRTPGESGSASRRGVLGAVAGLGVAAPLLAACGSGDDGGDAGGNDAVTPSGPVATTSEIPVGGGKIIGAEKIVVTQPTEGEFKAFTAVCTHQGCVVSEIKGDEIGCACHGSAFSIEDGSVVGGPAKKPLTELTVKVDGEDITVS